MGDLKDPRLIYLKGGLFLLLGVLAGGLIVAETGSLRVALLLVIAIWAFCRAYYFAFYVIEKYVDPTYKFAGLASLIGYWRGGRPTGKASDSAPVHCGSRCEPQPPP